MKPRKQDEHRFFIEVSYEDESNFNFEVILNGPNHSYMAQLMMITRGTLMASNAHRAIAYNDEGFDVVSYINNR